MTTTTTTTTAPAHGASVLAPGVQVTVAGALAVLFVLVPTQRGGDVLATVAGWLTGASAPGAARALLGLLLTTLVVLGVVVAIVLGVVRERLWAVAYTVEEVAAVTVLLGIYGWVLANSTVVFLVVVAAQGAAMTTRHRAA